MWHCRGTVRVGKTIREVKEHSTGCHHREDAEAYRAKQAGIDGMDGYRLAPCGRILNDYVFMRLAWNPDLTAEELIDEMAGYLTENAANRAKVAEAIGALDAYWEGKDQLANIDKAAQLFDEAKAGESS